MDPLRIQMRNLFKKEISPFACPPIGRVEMTEERKIYFAEALINQKLYQYAISNQKILLISIPVI